MKWSLDKIEPNSDSKISYGDPILFLGSCFSEHIFQKCLTAGLEANNTLFGTLFHPLSLSTILSQALSHNPQCEALERESHYFSWNASTLFYKTNEVDLAKAYEDELTRLVTLLKDAKALFITFGTSWGYRLKEKNLLVANCHKKPGYLFDKENTSVELMQVEWETVLGQLHDLNPNLEVVFTVSPVRHIRDGVVENLRSKSRLVLLCENLSERPQVSYFPSYEMVIDELRDYRFFESDLVHPNHLAIQEIWDRFAKCYLTQIDLEIMKEVLALRRAYSHRSLIPKIDFELKRASQLHELLEKYPSIRWE